MANKWVNQEFNDKVNEGREREKLEHYGWSDIVIG